MILCGSGPAAADRWGGEALSTATRTQIVTDTDAGFAELQENVDAPVRTLDPEPVPEHDPEQDPRPDPEPDVGLDRGNGDASVGSEVPPEVEDSAVPLSRPVVVLYGDSLAWEARHVFEQSLADHPQVRVVTRTYGGTAICDWLDEMAEDAATLTPGLVVIEFVGNNYTACMQDPAGAPLTGAALTDRYAADAATAIATFAPADTQVVLAGAPISQPATASLDLHHAPLNAVYEELGRRVDGVRYVDAGSTLLDDGEWTATLPCLPAEPCTDESAESGAVVNVVRSPDGLHFCPASADAPRGVTGDCPVWSSGAFRYGTALARPVLEALDAIARAPFDVS